MSDSRIISNVSLLFIGSLLANIFAFPIQVLIAQSFGSASYGVFTLANSILLIFATFITFGFSDSLVKFVGEYEDESRLAGTIKFPLYFSFILSIVFTVIIYFAAPEIFGSLLESNQLVDYLQVVILALPGIVLARLTSAVFLGFERAGMRILISELIYPIVFVCYIGTVIITGLGFDTVSIGHALSYLVTGLVGLILLIYFAKPILFSDTEYNISKLMSFSVPLMLSSQIGTMSNWVDTVLIGVFESSSLVGIYQSSFLLGTSVLIFMGAITGSLYPNFSKLVSNDKSTKLIHRYREGARWGIAVSSPPVFYLVFFSSSSLNTIFGPEFGAGAPALAIIAVGNLMGIAVGPGTEVVKSKGDSRFIFLTEMTALVANAILGLLLIPTIGIVGAAIGTAGATIITNFAHFYRAKRYFTLSLPTLDFFRALISSLTACFVGLQIDIVENPLTIILHIIIFSSVYVVAFYIAGGFNRDELYRLLAIISPDW